MSGSLHLSINLVVGVCVLNVCFVFFRMSHRCSAVQCSSWCSNTVGVVWCCRLWIDSCVFSYRRMYFNFKGWG